jgi:hypothetical protein
MRRRQVVGAAVTAFSGMLGGCVLPRSQPSLSTAAVPPLTTSPHYETAETILVRDLPADAPVTLTLSDQTLTLPWGKLTVTLVNDSTETIGTSFVNWSVLKLTPDGWRIVTHGPFNDGGYMLSPGKSHSWQIHLGGVLELGRDSETAAFIGTASPGMYAFAVPVRPPTTEGMYTALFRVQSPISGYFDD